MCSACSDDYIDPAFFALHFIRIDLSMCRFAYPFVYLGDSFSLFDSMYRLIDYHLFIYHTLNPRYILLFDSSVPKLLYGSFDIASVFAQNQYTAGITIQPVQKLSSLDSILDLITIYSCGLIDNYHIIILIDYLDIFRHLYFKNCIIRHLCSCDDKLFTFYIYQSSIDQLFCFFV